MPGAKIPVIEFDKLTIKKSGRGLYFDDDTTNFDVQTWTGTSGNTDIEPPKFLPAVSATAWARITDENSDTAYYLPLFESYW